MVEVQQGEGGLDHYRLFHGTTAFESGLWEVQPRVYRLRQHLGLRVELQQVRRRRGANNGTELPQIGNHFK